MPQSKLNFALDAAARNLRVFPQTGKVPGIRKWPDNASAKPSVVNRWWARRPDADIGIALDADTYVLDADSSEAVLALGSMCLPRTLTVLTSRGEHRYFRVPYELARQTSVCGVPGLEGKGRPGPVTWAGSVHPSGFVYRIAVDAPLAAMPPWLLERTGPRRSQVNMGEATAAERVTWSGAYACAQARLADPLGWLSFAASAVADARADLNMQLRALRLELPDLEYGWADRFFRVGAYLGAHVSAGALGLDDTIKELTAVFMECDTAGGDPAHVLRSIERGLAMGAREAAKAA